MESLSDCVYLPYLNTTQISAELMLVLYVGRQVFEGFFGKLLFRIIIYGE